ncbi:hypothetical protein [Dyella choica]|uniref:Tetratricopeptide repeat protein n=1 Tax=Dyella choica TaxID=1927959 RepID=A0A432M745_9GAMM|nr:hypothetical protein [Dyella choica]RUL76759.1 hypothetical protein EKH80_08590 [Dyella choica]
MRWLLPIALLITAAAYWPGLSGGWLFDDYPNIVDNPSVQPHEISVPAIWGAALSSPASEFKRPLASLSFAVNYLIGGLDPWSWKLFNLVVHLVNGVLVFLLARELLKATLFPDRAHPSSPAHAAQAGERRQHQGADWIAILIAAGWMLLPINLTAVLYVVQREESMANLFVLLGLLGYVTGRLSMLRTDGAANHFPDHTQSNEHEIAATAAVRPLASRGRSVPVGLWLCIASLILFTVIGLAVKETAVMLPLYAFLIEWIVFRLRAPPKHGRRRDWRIATMFALMLLLPLILGLIWLLPAVLSPSAWATRDFTLGTRLLSEARILCDYLVWTLLPLPHDLSFYHDDFNVSTGLLSPWTTLAGMLCLAALVALIFTLRRKQPLLSLSIALYLGCHLLTGTILPLELVYEHRNYFASFGVLLALVPLLAATPAAMGLPNPKPGGPWPAWLPQALLACLLLWWTASTATTAYAWGDPLRLARELASRGPDSPRAQYELGRTYIIYSHYDPASPYTELAYAPLERAAALPQSSILPQQALIFMNSRMGRPLKAQWWDSMVAKLSARPPGVQDESSLAALVQCARASACPLPTDRMVQAFETALAHPTPRLQAIYSDYAWNVLDDHALGLRMIEGAVQGAPHEPAYQVTRIRMLVAQGQRQVAIKALDRLRLLNTGGRLDDQLDELSSHLGSH